MPACPRAAAKQCAGDAEMLREHQLVDRVFVVDAQDAALAACIEREEMNRVAVRAELTLLPFGCARFEQHAVSKPRRVQIGHRRPETVAPTNEHVVAIARRQHYIVSLAALDAFEGQRTSRSRRRACAEQPTARDCKRRERGTRSEHAPASQTL